MSGTEGDGTARRQRRRRIPDRIDAKEQPPTPFDHDAWADDFRELLERCAAKHAAHMESPVHQRRKATAVLKVVGHQLNSHPDLRLLDWSDSLSLIALALDGLDEGKVEQFLLPHRPAGPARGAPKLSPAERDFIGFVLLTQLLLVEAGYGKIEADREVAKMLTKAGFSGREGPGFSQSTISGWRTNYPDKKDIFANKLLDRRLTRFLPRVQRMKAEGLGKTAVAEWLDKEIIRSGALRMLRPDARD